MKRNIMRIAVSAEAKKKYTKIPELHGMTRLSVSSHLVEWFGKLELPVQNAVITNGSSGKLDAANAVLKGMASK